MSVLWRMPVRNVSVLAAIAVLTACGGGGGGDGGGSGGVTPPAEVVTPTSLSMTQAQMLAGRAVQLADLAAAATLTTQQLYVLATSTVAPSGSEPCNGGGTVSYARGDADGNNLVSVGDTITLAGNNCRVLQGGSSATLDGRVDANVLLASGGSYFQGSGNWNLRTRHTYTAFTATANNVVVRMNGTLEVDDKALVHNYRFTNFVASAPNSGNLIQVSSGDIVLSTVTPAAGSSDTTRTTVQFNGLAVQTSLAANTKVNISVPAAAAPQLRLNAAGQPVGGTLVVMLDKAKITLTVTAPGQVRVDVDNGNDGSVDATQTLAWSALVAAGNP